MLRRSVLHGLVVPFLSLIWMLPVWDAEVDPGPVGNVPPRFDVSLPRFAENQLLAFSMFFDEFPDAGWKDWLALLELWGRESNWDDRAANPNSSAYGIPQGLTKLHKLEGTDYMSDPKAQIKWGLGYIRDKYKSPVRALEKWDERKEKFGEGSY